MVAVEAAVVASKVRYVTISVHAKPPVTPNAMVKSVVMMVVVVAAEAVTMDKAVMPKASAKMSVSLLASTRTVVTMVAAVAVERADRKRHAMLTVV